MITSSNVYEADIPVVAPGVELIYGPCVIRDITVTSDVSQATIVNFSNTITSYDSTYRNLKVVVGAQGTEHLVFPEGLYCSTGLCCIANNGSIDVRVTYD